MINFCPICNEHCSSKKVVVRSGKELELWQCCACSFEHFADDPTSNLIANKLDESRLQSAGLDIPSVEKDFANGIAQSTPYIDEYLDQTDKEKNILEIGCSWGYFLKLIQDFGAKPFGIELNRQRKNYIEKHLNISCYDDLAQCEAAGIRFKKIFMFYVLEYIPNPVQYIQRLIELLDDDGEIILVTPNLQDPLKDMLNNSGFKQFFYDEHAINYFTMHSIQKMIETLGAKHYQLATRQGYSFANHVNWFLTNRPTTTGVVGGDNFIDEMNKQIDPIKSQEAAALVSLIEDFDRRYKSFFEELNVGNQIRLQISVK